MSEFSDERPTIGCGKAPTGVQPKGTVNPAVTASLMQQASLPNHRPFAGRTGSLHPFFRHVRGGTPDDARPIVHRFGIP